MGLLSRIESVRDTGERQETSEKIVHRRPLQQRLTS
jgi:hypothetical protein